MRTARQTIVLTTLGELEVVNAFELRVYRKEASPSQSKSYLQNFQEDLRQGLMELRPLTEEVFERALQLSKHTTAKSGTAAADLLHIAAALEMGAEFLYSFDKPQRRLASSLGLKLN